MNKKKEDSLSQADSYTTFSTEPNLLPSHNPDGSRRTSLRSTTETADQEIERLQKELEQKEREEITKDIERKKEKEEEEKKSEEAMQRMADLESENNRKAIAIELLEKELAEIRETLAKKTWSKKIYILVKSIIFWLLL